MPNKSILLNGEWQLAWADNHQVCDEKIEIKTFSDLTNQKGINAIVPGNFELDLYRNGLIEDPFYGENVTQMTRYEYVHMWYGRQFEYSGCLSNVFLDFEGIDTIAEVYLNGTLIGKTDNMLIAHKLEARTLKEGINDLVVHILPVTIEARKLPSTPGDSALEYNYAGLRVRKPAHTYGWDIMPRIVSGGLWRDVKLVQEQADRIEDTYLYTVGIRGEGQRSNVVLYYRMQLAEDDISRYTIEVKGQCGDSSFYKQGKLWFNSGHLKFEVENSKLWWIIGRGEPNLYQVQVNLLLDGKIVDSKNFHFGIRTVELVRTSVTDSKGNGDFHIKVNGERVFIKGVNWVPADAFHSRDKERIPKMLELVKDIGCNMIRCWGGNVYEDHDFFDICDRNGFLIWQDFSFGCGIYPQDDVFCQKVTKEIQSVVTKLRQHPSLGIWAGDNECDVAYAGSWSGFRRDPNQNRITRQVIPDVLKMEDPIRPYLPSSPFVDSVAFEKGLEYLPEDHLWGPRDYYKSNYYQNAMAHFASEMGYHGCNAPKSVEQFISQENRWPVDNREWMVHCAPPEAEQGPYSYRRELMFKQVRELFKEIPDNLEEFALASQISQAEAMKFFVELFRCMKWHRSGIIWWNMIDGWPQFSDAVVDYYFNKKLAYHYIKTAQQPLCLMFAEPKDWHIKLMVSNDTKDKIDFTYTVTDITQGNRIICNGSNTAFPDECKEIAMLNYSMAEKGVYLIEWQAGEYSGKNHYLYGNTPFEFGDYVKWMKQADLLRADGFTQIQS